MITEIGTAAKRKKSVKAVDENQLTLDMSVIQQRRFSLEKFVTRKLQALEEIVDQLTYQDITWLARVEDFMLKYGYLTERQLETLDSIYKRHRGQILN